MFSTLMQTTYYDVITGGFYDVITDADYVIMGLIK